MERVNVFGLYSIRDCLAEEYGPLFQAVNDGVAVRQFQKILVDIPISSRGDYVLVCFGKMDTVSGDIHVTPPQEIYSSRENDTMEGIIK